MHEADLVVHAGRIRFRILAVECEMELEVRELPFYFVEILEIESFFQAARPIEEVHLAGCLLRLEKMHYMASHGCHAGASAYEYEFLVCRSVVRNEELAVRSGYDYLVPWLAGEYVR